MRVIRPGSHARYRYRPKASLASSISQIFVPSLMPLNNRIVFSARVNEPSLVRATHDLVVPVGRREASDHRRQPRRLIDRALGVEFCCLVGAADEARLDAMRLKLVVELPQRCLPGTNDDGVDVK